MNLKKMKRTWIRSMSVAIAGILAVPTSLVVLSGCNKGSKKDNIVLMTEELTGLFNPFYATAGTDMDVIGLTQIGMLTTDRDGNPVAGDQYATVVKDFEYEVVPGNNDEDKTVYTFVIKNGLKFSDGKPLTINDVFFNMYEYLDPVYTGSSSMYAIDIEGLAEYRLQGNYANSDQESESIANTAAANAWMRISELIDVYQDCGEKGENSYAMTEAEMEDAISNWGITPGFKVAVSTEQQRAEWTDEQYQAVLLADYRLALETFKKELQNNFNAAKDAFDTTTVPYSDWKKELSNDVFKFFLREGLITPEYNKIQGKIDRTKIVRFTGMTDVSSYTKETAINRVYSDKTKYELHRILTERATASTLNTQFTAEATDIILQGLKKEDGSLEVRNVRGIKSLGHDTDVTKVNVNGTDYTVARDYNTDGTPKNAGEHAVLQITVNGTDPKAIYNFGFTVAPAHYYGSRNGKGDDVVIDIQNKQFGVEYGSSEFQSKVIQAQQHQEVPVGAGPFMATDINNSDMPAGNAFWNNGVVYYKANRDFMFEVKSEKLRMQVISSSNAMDKLAQGEVDYITPQFTKDNYDRLLDMKSKGFDYLEAWQLGYGYIGINAGKIPDENIRKAIMSAMQTDLALEFYAENTCKTIDWPMSRVSWAYPFEDDGETSKTNKSPYTQWTGRAKAIEKIKEYMRKAGVQAGDPKLDITFTIAGASITDHPTYNVFKQAAEILNDDCGWKVEVEADAQALTKLATGNLTVWAAAWGSTIDPDMYQIYHKNSSASSVLAWGYRDIRQNRDSVDFAYESAIIDELSDKIDYARSIMRSNIKEERALRKVEYERAMQLVLDLAVEMPVYQRKTLYAYNKKTIKGLISQAEMNDFTSPLERVWELELVK